MAKKFGHNYERDPYPWDIKKSNKHADEWSCCDMNLPGTFYICPICEKERTSDGSDADIEQEAA